MVLPARSPGISIRPISTALLAAGAGGIPQAGSSAATSHTAAHTRLKSATDIT